MSFASAPALALAAALLATGCYLSHDPGDPPDDVPPLPDPCARLRIAETVLLGTDDDSGTPFPPWLVALPGNRVGAFYTNTLGPTHGLIYERLGPNLERETGPILLEPQVWQIGAPTIRGDEIIFTHTPDGSPSRIERIDFDGVRRADPVTLPFRNGRVLRATPSGGVFWLGGFVFELDPIHLGPDLLPTHDPAPIDIGPYPNYPSAITRSDGALIFTYYAGGKPLEARRAHLAVLSEDGRHGPDREVTDAFEWVTTVVRQGSRVVVVHGGPDQLVLEVVDERSLDTLERHTFPMTAEIAATAADRLVVAHSVHERTDPDSPRGVIRIDDFGRTLDAPAHLEVPFEGAAYGTEAVSLPDGTVIGTTLDTAARGRPFLIRIDCVPEAE